MGVRRIIFFIITLLEFSGQSLIYAQNSLSSYVKGVYSLPLTLDPIQMNDTASLAVANLIYDGLLKFSPTLEIEGALAKSWSTSSDGTILIFDLRENIYFHSGDPVTALDAEVSLKRALSSISKVRKYYDSIKDIKAIDAKKLKITLTQPFPPFLSILAGSTAKILPKKEINNPQFFNNPVGSGAFKFSSLDKSKKELTLVQNLNHYAGTPKIEKMILKETSEEDAIKLAKDGKINDLASWPLSQDNSIFSLGRKISSPVAATWIIGINTTKAPFNDLKIRQIFKSHIPSDDFRNKFYPDAIRANGYVPYGLPGSQISRKVDASTFSPSKEKIKIVIPQELAQAVEMKAMLEKVMNKKGWNLEVILMSWDKLMEGYTNKSFQAFLVSMNMDYPDADFLLKNFESDSVDNFSGFKNENVDRLLKMSRSTQDRKKRNEYYKEALQIIEESALTANLFHPRANYWVSDCVEGFIPNILSEVYIDYSKVTNSTNCYPKNVVKK